LQSERSLRAELRACEGLADRAFAEFDRGLQPRRVALREVGQARVGLERQGEVAAVDARVGVQRTQPRRQPFVAKTRRQVLGQRVLVVPVGGKRGACGGDLQRRNLGRKYGTVLR